MILRFTGVDINRGQKAVDHADVDTWEAGPIAGTVITTKSGNQMTVNEDFETVTAMMEQAKEAELNNSCGREEGS